MAGHHPKEVAKTLQNKSPVQAKYATHEASKNYGVEGAKRSAEYVRDNPNRAAYYNKVENVRKSNPEFKNERRLNKVGLAVTTRNVRFVSRGINSLECRSNINLTQT